MKNEVKLGVIGCGGMAQAHMKMFAEIPRYRFVAASDTSASALDNVVRNYKVPGFADGHDLIKSGMCDAVLIATPHYFHPVYAAAALQHGLHVLTEKPVAVTAAAAEEVNRVSTKHPKQQFAAMFQLRSFPRWVKVKQILTSGQLGKIQRVQWTITNWFRSQAYYNSGSWRATWAGEGGGTLLNQCPHNLDMLYWLLGSPSRIQAHLGLGRYHRIEVEDEVTAFLQYPNGATGVFITSTGEAPGTDFLEIIGDQGKMTINGSRIEMTINNVSAAEYCHTTKESFSLPPSHRVTVEIADGGSHKAIHNTFVAAILDGAPLIAPASEGIHSVEMANAMIMSGITGKALDLPMDRPAYDRFLKKLVIESKIQGPKSQTSSPATQAPSPSSNVSSPKTKAPSPKLKPQRSKPQAQAKAKTKAKHPKSKAKS